MLQQQRTGSFPIRLNEGDVIEGDSFWSTRNYLEIKILEHLLRRIVWYLKEELDISVAYPHQQKDQIKELQLTFRNLPVAQIPLHGDHEQQEHQWPSD